MSIFKTAYQTTACKDFVTKKTMDAGEVALLSSALWPLGPHMYTVQGGSATADAIPAFGHPMVILDSSKKEVLMTDVRPFGKYNGVQAQWSVRNSMEYKMALHRLNLNHIWLSDSGPTELRDLSLVPVGVFSSWISEALTKRFALDPREQLNIAILSAVYYFSLFHDEMDYSDHDVMRMTGAISRALRVSATDILTVLDRIKEVYDTLHIADIKSFCWAAEHVAGGENAIRLKDLSVGILYGILGGSWSMAANGKEMVAVALEHPPTWMTILMGAFSEATFKNSGIAKICERSSYRDTGKNFMFATIKLMDTNTVRYD